MENSPDAFVLPSIEVEPELVDAIESLLGEGETLAQFIEYAVRRSIRARVAQGGADGTPTLGDASEE